jgi:hypothetical protein
VGGSARLPGGGGPSPGGRYGAAELRCAVGSITGGGPAPPPTAAAVAADDDNDSGGKEAGRSAPAVRPRGRLATGGSCARVPVPVLGPDAGGGGGGAVLLGTAGAAGAAGGGSGGGKNDAIEMGPTEPRSSGGGGGGGHAVAGAPAPPPGSAGGRGGGGNRAAGGGGSAPNVGSGNEPRSTAHAHRERERERAKERQSACERTRCSVCVGGVGGWLGGWVSQARHCVREVWSVGAYAEQAAGRCRRRPLRRRRHHRRPACALCVRQAHRPLHRDGADRHARACIASRGKGLRTASSPS